VQTGTIFMDREIHSPKDLFEVASDLINEAGLAGLTTRALAAAFDVNLSVLAYQLGQKDEILRKITDFARAQEAAFIDNWLNTLSKIPTLSRQWAAIVLDGFIESLITEYRASTLLFSELIFNHVSSAGVADELEQWHAKRRELFRALSRRIHPAVHYDFEILLEGFVIEYCAFGLALQHNPAYRMLRRLTVNRLCDGLIARDGSGDQILFSRTLNELSDSYDLEALKTDNDLSPRRKEIAEAAAAIIVDEGMNSITHRSVATRIGVTGGTVAHYFPKVNDLVAAAIRSLLPLENEPVLAAGQDFFTRPDDPAQPVQLYKGYSIARVGFAVSLAASRQPRLIPKASFLLQHRGRSLLEPLAGLAAPANFDLLSSHILANCAAGHCNRLSRLGQSFAHDFYPPMLLTAVRALREEALATPRRVSAAAPAAQKTSP